MLPASGSLGTFTSAMEPEAIRSVLSEWAQSHNGAAVNDAHDLSSLLAKMLARFSTAAQCAIDVTSSGFHSLLVVDAASLWRLTGGDEVGIEHVSLTIPARR